MTKKQIKYIITRTFQETILNLVFLLDFLLRDLTIFSVIRRFLFWTVAKIGKWTRIRKWQYLTHINKLKIWNNCFVNRKNIFDNSWNIEIGNNCSIGYDNKFITTSHYEKWKIHLNKNDFTSYSQGIKIWSNVWITTWCTILPWTVIWDNVILAAGSVAKGGLKWWYIYGWVPAKEIRETNGFISKTI